MTKKKVSVATKIAEKTPSAKNNSEPEIRLSSVYSSRELENLNFIMKVLIKSPDQKVRNMANALKGQFRSVEGIIASCYPHQMNNGRPARIVVSPLTSEREWRVYQQISIASAKKIFVTCWENYLKRTNKLPAVEIHHDGDLVKTP